MRFLAFICLFSLWGTAAMAQSYTLSYQKENRWVAKEDNKPLRDLLKTAKQKKTFYFAVILPKEQRALSVERLSILRDILLDSLNVSNIVIEEVSGKTAPNTVVITVTP